jgi:penicillin-binding protein 1A
LFKTFAPWFEDRDAFSLVADVETFPGDIVAHLPTRNRLFRAIWTVDSFVSSTFFELWDACKRSGSAYSSFLHRFFRISGLRRWLIDFIDDAFTFGVVAAFGLLAYALPPFSGTGDVWNRGREYAVTFTDANGEIIGQRGIRQDDAIPLEDIPPHLIKAVLATEDARFFDHFGVDIIGTFRAAARNAKSDGRVQGGSSITQQVAKNLFLSPERTLRRKVHEAFLSLWIEARLSKQEILKLYLDRSYLGGGNYGVEAAAQFYFGKSVRDINISEAAILGGLFKAPTSYAPHQNPEAARARSNVVLYRMLDAGFITQGELLQAKRTPAVIVANKDLNAPDWYLDWAYQDTLDVLENYGLTGDYVIEVKTTIDTKLQRASQAVLNEALALQGEQEKFSQAASVTMAPDGAVKAIVGGKDYEESQFNRATDAERQSGSSFKPFVYLAALRAGWKPNQIVVDGPVSYGNWSPKNYSGKYAGRTTLTSALAHSYNSIPVKILQDVGIKPIVKAAHDMGIQGDLETWAPMVLGTSALTLLDLTTGYATFAGGGKLATPYAVLEIRKPTGDIIYARAKNAAAAAQVESPQVIADLNVMLSAVVKSGTARKADLGYAPQGGKTGTNQGYRDAWYVGFTAHNVTGVWVGNDDFTPMNEVTGGRIPAPLWKSITDVAEQGLQPEGLVGIPLDGTYTQVASVEPAPTVADETPDVTADTAGIASSDPGQEVLNGMLNLFEKKPTAIAAPQTKKKTAKSRRKVATSEPTLRLPKVNARREPKRSFLDSLFNSRSPKKKRKPLFSF